MISLFVDDARFIGIFATALTILIMAIIIIIFRNKLPFVKKHYTQVRMNTLMFVIACIFGLTVSGINGFQIFDEALTDRNWIKHFLYFLSGTNGFILGMMFLWFICMLPFRYFANIQVFLSFKKPWKRFLKISLFYTFFAFIAIAIASMQYGFGNSFFSFDSSFSYARQKVNFDFHPTYYVIGRYFFTYILKDWVFTVAFIFTILLICLIEYIVIKIIRQSNYAKLIRIVEKVDRFSEWSKFINYTTPILIFVSLTLSLSTHTIATTLHLSLVFLMLIILTIIIFAMNCGYTAWSKTMNYKQYISLIKVTFFEAWKSKEIVSCYETIKKHHVYEHLDLIGNEQNTYNIFATIIYPIVITSFLGFASGPLLRDGDATKHILFWISLFIIGYLLIFAYTFKYSSIISSKMMMGMGTAYIITTFNTGILNYFNPIINKLATFASITTLYSIALNHARRDAKNKLLKI